MDIHSLDSAVQRYYSAALAASPIKTYKAAEHRYLDFCSKFVIIPLPTLEATLCYFTTCLGQQGISYNTIRTYLSGIRQIQIAHGFKDPHKEYMPQLIQVLKGIKVKAAKAGKPTLLCLPITPLILWKVKTIWMGGSSESFNNIMLWVASLTTFSLFTVQMKPEAVLATRNWSSWLYSSQSAPKKKRTKLLECIQEYNQLFNDGYTINKDVTLSHLRVSVV